MTDANFVRPKRFSGLIRRNWRQWYHDL